jgi:hypothetical protein
LGIGLGLIGAASLSSQQFYALMIYKMCISTLLQ